MWKGYLRADENGNIRQITTSLQPQPGAVVIEDRALIEEISLHQDRYLLVGNEVREKPVAVLVADKTEIAADGIDMAVVHLAGMPASYQEAKLFVATGEVTLPVGESIEVTSEEAMPLMIALREPRIWCDPLWIMARVP
jgi:hypothetical protein